MPGPVIELTVDQRSLQRLKLRLAREDDGKRLKRELARNLRLAATPIVAQIRDGANAIKRESSARQPGRYAGAGGGQHLGPAIAAATGVQVRFGGKGVGVRIRSRKTAGVRGFTQAPRRFNAKRFRHRVFGTDRWVYQIGNPGFFDKPIKEHRALFRLACRRAMDDMARRIAH